MQKNNLESKNNLVFILIIILLMIIILFGKDIYDYRHQLPLINSKYQPKLTNKQIEEIFAPKVDVLLKTLKFRNFRLLEDFIHPKLGVRFSPYPYILGQDKIFTYAQIKKYYDHDKLHDWGYEGDMQVIKLNFKDYYAEYIYSEDFTNYDEINFNILSNPTRMLDNTRKFYDKAVIIEVKINSNIIAEQVVDWSILRLVFESYKNKWYLIAIVNLRATQNDNKYLDLINAK